VEAVMNAAICCAFGYFGEPEKLIRPYSVTQIGRPYRAWTAFR
jgi:hypothetical protein